MFKKLGTSIIAAGLLMSVLPDSAYAQSVKLKHTKSGGCMQVKAGGIKVLPCEDIAAQRIDISNDEFRINAGGGDACVKVNERNILLTKSCDTPPPPTKWTFTAIGQIEMAGRDLCLVKCDCPTGFDPAEAILVACKADTEEQKWEVVKK